MADGASNFQMVVDPETGDLEYSYPDEATTTLETTGHFENLAGVLEDSTTNSVCSTLTEVLAHDLRGREEWLEIAEDAYDLLGIGPETEADSDTGYEDTSDHPLMLTALTRFQSKAYSALLPVGHRAVRTEPAQSLEDIDDPDEREEMSKLAAEAGARVERFYTYYLFKRCKTYQTETDQLLHDCGMVGGGVRKIHTDKSRKNMPVVPRRVAPNDLIISYDGSRITHRIRMTTSELVRMMQSGQYRPIETLSPTEPDTDAYTAAVDRMSGVGGGYRSDETHTLYEIHCQLRLTEDAQPDGLTRPYIVTIHQASQEVLAITRNWEDGDVDEERIEHFVVYPFSPGKDTNSPVGLGHILSNITRALRKAQRAGLDAGYFQNHPSGFKLSNFSVRDGSTKLRPGEFMDVDAPTDDIRKSIMSHPFAGPSQGLLAMADKIEANGKELGGIASIDFAQLMKAGIAAGPAMAAYEESATFQTAIHRRLYTAMATELEMIHARMRQIHGNKPISYGTNGILHPGDLTMVNILPVMKPGEMSKQKTLLESQAIWDMAQAMPDIIDRRKAAERMLRALGDPNIEDIMLPDPEDEQPEPLDPISEYGAALRGMPLRAGLSQNHQAHIDTHAAQMRMLTTSQLPVEKGEAAMAALSAHIAEHMAQQLLVEVARRAGIPPQQFEQGIPPELEGQLAPIIAEAMMAIEQERAAASGDGNEGQEKVAIEQVKHQGRMTELSMKQRHENQMAELKRRHELELQGRKDAAAMAREEADNEAAIEIASMRGDGKSNASAGARGSAGAGAGAEPNASAGSGAE